MLPHSYEIPAALVLVLAGAVACFAGYRLFRIVLAVFGFILGAMLVSSLMGISNTAGKTRHHHPEGVTDTYNRARQHGAQNEPVDGEHDPEQSVSGKAGERSAHQEEDSGWQLVPVRQHHVG